MENPTATACGNWERNFEYCGIFVSSPNRISSILGDDICIDRLPARDAFQKINMKKIVASIQSSYIPWKGYFDVINAADEFIFLDHVQYTKQDWRNRNRIKSHRGDIWLTVPVEKSKTNIAIKDVRVADAHWGRKHWNIISASYAKAPYFKEFRDVFKPLFLSGSEKFLCEVNYKFIFAINKILGITTPIRWSTDYDLAEGKTERLIDLCKKLKADVYLCGPAAHSYLDEASFREAGMEVEWIDYSGYVEYDQLFPPFEHQVSIVDLILHKGAAAPEYMKSFGVDVAGQKDRA